MTLAYDTTGHLLVSVSRRTFVPQSGAALSAADILRVMTEELRSSVVPLLLRVAEEFYVQESDTALVAGTAEYAIPSRAGGLELRDVQVLAASGESRSLAWVDPEEMVGRRLLAGPPSRFCLKAESVVVHPTPSAAGETLRLSYHRWPSHLVPTVEAGAVTTTAGNVANLGSVPGTFTTSTPLDVVQGRPPFKILGADLLPSAVGGSSVTFSSLPTGIVAGDYVCLAGESPVAQVPHALYPLLVERTVGTILRSKGDLKRYAASAKESERLERLAVETLGKRVVGEARRVPNGMAKWSRPWGGW